MLFKEACIKCRRNTDEGFSLERFNKLWLEGYVVCPSYYFDPIPVKGKNSYLSPPDECPFALEHFLVKHTRKSKSK